MCRADNLIEGPFGLNGLLLFILLLCGVGDGRSEYLYIENPEQGEAISLPAPGSEGESIMLLLKGNRLMGMPPIGISLTCAESRDTLRIGLAFDPDGSLREEREGASLRVTLQCGDWREEKICGENLEFLRRFEGGGESVVGIHLNPSSSETMLALTGGENATEILAQTGRVEALASFLSARTLEMRVSGRARLLAVAAETPDTDEDYFTQHTAETIRSRLDSSSDPLEGYWQLLDYTVNDSMLQPGGHYVLAMISTPGGAYKLLYISGADKNPGGWKPGDVKGILTPSPSAGTFSLKWIDAAHTPLPGEGTLQKETARLLQVSFPWLQSSLRLIKIPAPV